MKSKDEESIAMQTLSSNFDDQIEMSHFNNSTADSIAGQYEQETEDKAVDHADHHTDHHIDDNQSLEQVYRAGAYSMLAELFRQSPQQDVLNKVTGLAEVVEDKDDFAIAMSMLGLSARAATADEIDDEFHALFIGLGRGELVPYGSWYQTGFLMEKPLGVLRDDLASMGFERNKGTCEPEDHVAALCEVMALLINEGRDIGEQKVFFDEHISSWFGQFYTDLGKAKSAIFYRAVARFGKAFFDFEKQYLAMSV